MANTKGLSARERRKLRVRKKVSGSSDRPRMSVFRSNRHISVQIIDDLTGKTLAAASTNEKDQREREDNGSKAGAERIGSLIGERAKAKGINQVVFDRNGFLYQGRVKALADAARKTGLKF